jgi:ABC-type transporter Mla MlaB component
MKNLLHTISEDMYHRVYRLMRRDIDSRLIASALNLPLRTVLNVIARLKKNELADQQSPLLPAGEEKKSISAATFLDVYCLTKTRYSMLQLVGHLVKEEMQILEQELQKVETSVWKAVAIRMSDVVELDAACARLLLDFFTRMTSHERFVAILDPPARIEKQLIEFKIEGKVPIFGTERTFEEHAFPRKAAMAPHSRNP